MHTISNYLERLLAKKNLTAEEMTKVMQECMTGKLTDAQIAAFLVLMRMKGETVEELTSAAKVMLAQAKNLDLGTPLVDIVGTGGDGKNTFNVSTVSSFVAAAAGARVAKHGNRSVSSRSGSADLLMRAGIQLDLDDQQLQTCMQRFNLCFLFAPHFHKAMQHARNARKELGVRSLFNLLGPLINPAGATHQVVGVFDPSWQKPLAEVLANLGCKHALVVSSEDGLDEISIAAPSIVYEYKNGIYSQWLINPKEFGCWHSSLDEIIVQSPEDSFNCMLEVLEGKRGAARSIVLLNSAAALYCAELTHSFGEAINKAATAIDNGTAINLYHQLQKFSKNEL